MKKSICLIIAFIFLFVQHASVVQAASVTMTKQWFYNNDGQVVNIIDAEGGERSTEYNSIGKISAVTDKNGARTTYDIQLTRRLQPDRLSGRN